MNQNLTAAKAAKNDEFYTQLDDINREVNAYLEYDENVFRGKTILLPCDDPEWSNFTKLFVMRFKQCGIKKLISTSYAFSSKPMEGNYTPTEFEIQSPNFNAELAATRGKIFTLTEDKIKDGDFNLTDLEWDYLEGDGDFRSEEVTALRDEADFIITNPPFSLFREFLAWITEADKKFLMLGNKNCVTYKEVFPLIKNNRLWAGTTPWAGGMWFETVNLEDVDRVRDGVSLKNVPSVWLTNIEHGRRHQPLPLSTMANNLRFSKNKFIREFGYPQYDNYDAIEVAATKYIPSDYEGAMGVPISFLDKYCPEQFEIIGEMVSTTIDEYNFGYPFVNGKKVFARILIKHRQ